MNNPSEQLGFYEAGVTKALAAFTPERLPLFKDAPTFRELGKDFVYFMQRTVVGAPGMSGDARAYYTALFTKVFNSKEWQTYRSKKSLQGDFLTGDALMDYWKRERAVHKQMLINMGAIKASPLFKDAPTFRELGKDFVYFMQRTVVGAPGMSGDARAYYTALFTKVFNSKEWQTYRSKKSLQGDFLTGDALMDYWKRERAVHKQMLIDMGAIKG